MPAAIAAKMKQAQAQVATLPPEQRAVAEQMLAQQMPQLAQMMTQAAATAAPELFDATDAEAHAKPSSQYCAAPPDPRRRRRSCATLSRGAMNAPGGYRDTT
jgi:DNA-binding protein H-NS